MNKLPELDRLSEPEKDALIAALWAEVQRLKARLEGLEAKAHEPRKDAHNSSVPPSHTPNVSDDVKFPLCDDGKCPHPLLREGVR
jgi:uncharacterized small protein (DUF1192 family)